MGGVWLSEGEGERAVWDSQCANSRFTGQILLNLNLHSDQWKHKDFCVKIPLARTLPAEVPSPSILGLCRELVPWMTHGEVVGLPKRTCIEHPLTKSKTTCFVLKWQVVDTFRRNGGFIHACMLKCECSFSGECSTGPLGPYRIHCRYTDLRSHRALCRCTYRMIIIHCWND